MLTYSDKIKYFIGMIIIGIHMADFFANEDFDEELMNYLYG